MVQAFVVPALRTEREERGTRFLGGASEIKGRATRPNCSPRFKGWVSVSVVTEESS